jgi:ABC-type multidrug transport system permease subunit
MEIPYVFVQTTYYTLIVYAMMSFQWTAAKFFWFFFISYFSFLYFTFYGMMTVSISPNHEVAAIFAAAFYSLFNLFSGFFIPRPVSCPFNQTIPTTLSVGLQKLIIFFSTCFREFLDGGSGTTGFAHWHGLCMGS